MISKVSSYVAPLASTALKLATSKEMILTALAVTVLENIPTVSASASTYAKCFKKCMDGAGNMALVAIPVCAAACTVTLPF